MSVFRETAATVAAQIHRHVAQQVRLAKATTPDDPFLGEQADTFLASLDLAGMGALAEDLTDVLADVALSGARQGMTTVRLLVPGAEAFALPSDAVQDWARTHSASLVGKRVLEDGTVIDNPRAGYAIDEVTRDMLRATVRDAFAQEMTFPELEARIQQSGAFSDARAETIARNEVGEALVQGNLAVYQASGVVSGLQWILADTHPEPDECDQNDGAEVALGQPFPSGDFAPPLHVNCLCDVLPVVGGEE